jgi:glutathione S-transferase
MINSRRKMRPHYSSAKDAGMIDLHTTPTANGYKAAIMLEEVGLPYRVNSYNLVKGEHQTPAFLKLNPMGRLPLIVDHDAGAATPVSVYGTGAILTYLGEKTRRYLPQDAACRAKVFEWLGIISSDVGPAYSGQFVFNVIMPEKIPAAIEFYNKLCTRMLGVIEQQLAQSEYLAGPDYTIADIIAYPVAATSMQRYPGNFDLHPNIARWSKSVAARPAVQKGMRVPPS